MAYSVQVRLLLAHPHAWVQLTSCQLLGQVFGGCDLEEIVFSLVATAAGSGEAQPKRKKRRLSHFLVDGGIETVRTIEPMSEWLSFNGHISI